MWDIIIYIAIAVLVGTIVCGFRNLSRSEKKARIPGLRKPRKYDNYEEKSCEQFREECHRNSIDVDYTNMPNLCTYLRILEMKDMHLELVKDGLVRYDYSNKENFDVEAWIQKWNRIVFSPNIGAEDFCKCIRTIMKAHGFDEYQNTTIPSFKGNDGLIKSHDSFFMFRALHIMHYHILIRKNNPQLKDFEISHQQQMLEKGGCPIDDVYETKALKDLANVEAGIKLWDRDIRTVGNYPHIIYMHNILTSPSEVKYYGGATDVDTDIVIMGLKAPFDMNICNESAVIAEGIAAIQVTEPIISCEYLFLFLKLICHKLKNNGTDEIKEDDLKAINIVVLPSRIQREIIRKGMPIKDDLRQLEAVFDSYKEEYPLLQSFR